MRQISAITKRQVDLISVAEVAAGTTFSILLAGMFGLKYSAVAGITTLLTIQNTRGATLKTTGKRMVAFALMVVLCAATLLPLQFHTLSFGLFLLLFVGLCYLLDLQSVIASSAVLATHFLMERSMAPDLIINELGLLLTGSGIGVLVKLIIPRRRAPLTRFRDDIENAFKAILQAMAGKTIHTLTDAEDPDRLNSFDRLEKMLADYENAALFESDNHLLGEGKYPVAYFQMRSRQASFLRRIWQNLSRTGQSHGTNFLLADFFKEVADGFSEGNTALHMLQTLERIDHVYDRLPLPLDRKEFEDRALLYAVIQDMRSLLQIKRDFFLSANEDGLQAKWQ